MSIGKMKGRPTAEICADCSAPGMILCYSLNFKCSAFLILLPFSLSCSRKHELHSYIFSQRQFHSWWKNSHMIQTTCSFWELIQLHCNIVGHILVLSYQFRNYSFGSKDQKIPRKQNCIWCIDWMWGDQGSSQLHNSNLHNSNLVSHNSKILA